MFENRIDIDAIAEYLDKKDILKPKEMEFRDGDKVIKYHVGQYMTAEEMTLFVTKVSEACFVEDEYHPEFLEIAFGITFMQMLTDLPLCETEDNKGNKIIDVDKTFAIYWGLDLENILENNFFQDGSPNLYLDLRESVKKAVQFRKDRIITSEKQQVEYLRKELEDGIAMINAAVDKINEQNEVVLRSDEFKKTAELADKMKNISEEEVVKVLNNKKKENNEKKK